MNCKYCNKKCEVYYLDCNGYSRFKCIKCNCHFVYQNSLKDNETIYLEKIIYINTEYFNIAIEFDLNKTFFTPIGKYRKKLDRLEINIIIKELTPKNSLQFYNKYYKIQQHLKILK